MSDVTDPQHALPTGLLLSRDLIFTEKVTGTARALGRSILTAVRVEQALAHIAVNHPRLVVLDLASGDLTSVEAIAHYREHAGPEAVFIAFGSHVESARLTEAATAGCDLVLPRSRFVVELPALIERHLPRSATEPTGQ